MPLAAPEAVLVDIIRRTDGHFAGKSKLFKAFYFAHLFYSMQNPGVLTDWPIACMPRGPGIHDSETLFGRLVDDGVMTIETSHEGPYPEYVYHLTEKASVVSGLPDQAAWAVQRAVDFVREKSAAQLSAYIHEYSRSWNEAEFGDILNIYIDLIPDHEYRKRSVELAQLNQRLSGIF